MPLFTQDVKVKALGRAPLFSKKDLTALARMSEDVELEPGTVLCKQGCRDLEQERAGYFV